MFRDSIYQLPEGMQDAVQRVETVGLEGGPVSYTAPWWTAKHKAWLLYFERDHVVQPIKPGTMADWTGTDETTGAVEWACHRLLDVCLELPERPAKSATAEQVREVALQVKRVERYIVELKLWAEFVRASVSAAGYYSSPTASEALRQYLYNVADENGTKPFKRYDVLRLYFRYRTPEYRLKNAARNSSRKVKAYRRERYARQKLQ